MDLQNWMNYKKSYEQVGEFLNKAESSKDSINIMVPFGPLAFFPGVVDDKNKVTIILSDNLFVERTLMEAKEICTERIAQVNERVASLLNQQASSPSQNKHNSEGLDSMNKASIQSLESLLKLVASSEEGNESTGSNPLLNEEGLKFVDIKENYEEISKDKQKQSCSLVHDVSSKQKISLDEQPTINPDLLDDFDRNLLKKLAIMSTVSKGSSSKSFDEHELQEAGESKNINLLNTSKVASSPSRGSSVSSGHETKINTTGSVSSTSGSTDSKPRRPPPRKMEKRVSFSERFTKIDPNIPQTDDILADSKKVSFSEKITEIHSGEISDDDVVASSSIDLLANRTVTEDAYLSPEEEEENNCVKVAQEAYLSPDDEEEEDEIVNPVMSMKVVEHEKLPDMEEDDYELYLAGKQLSSEYHQKRGRMIAIGSIAKKETDIIENEVIDEQEDANKKISNEVLAGSLYPSSGPLSPDIIRYMRRSSSSEKHPSAYKEPAVVIKSQRRIEKSGSKGMSSSGSFSSSQTFKPNLTRGKHEVMIKDSSEVEEQQKKVQILDTTVDHVNKKLGHLNVVEEQKPKTSIFKMRRQDQQADTSESRGL